MALTDRIEDARIGVLCGGPGAEREISLLSGAAVTRGLTEAGLSVIMQDVSDAPGEIEALPFDLVFNALHGEFGEDGEVQRRLESAGILYTGSDAHASALGIDKHKSKLAMVAEGLPTAPWVVVGDEDDPAEVMAAAGLSLPVVVKPNSRGSSVGTTIVRESPFLTPALRTAFKFDALVMIEAFVPGLELTASVLDDQALPLISMTPTSEFYDYHAKYHSDETGYSCPADLDETMSKDLAQLGLACCRCLGARDLARVDLILAESGPMILEINTSPGFTDHSLLPKAAAVQGYSFPLLCRTILSLAWARRRD